MGGKPQLQDLALNTGEVGVQLLAGGIAGAAKDDMVEGVDGPVPGRHLVGGCVGHHVGSHREIQFPSGKNLPQPVQIRGRCQIDRDVVGEEVHVKLIRYGHGDDLPPHQGGLGLFGPRELVHSQVHFKPQIPDLLDDALVAQGEGVEGPRENATPLRCGKTEGAAFDMMGDDEAVDVAQGGGGVEEGQLLFGLFVDEEKHLLGQQGEKLRLILVVQGAGGEQPFAQDAEGLLPHGVPIGGKALEQQSRHPLAPAERVASSSSKRPP